MASLVKGEARFHKCFSLPMARATCRVDRPFTRLTFSLAAYRRLAPKGQPIHPINREETGRNLAPSIFSFFFSPPIHRIFFLFLASCETNIVKEGNFCCYSLLIKNKMNNGSKRSNESIA